MIKIDDEEVSWTELLVPAAIFGVLTIVALFLVSTFLWGIGLFVVWLIPFIWTILVFLAKVIVIFTGIFILCVIVGIIAGAIFLTLNKRNIEL
jgi:hypothetical protein